MSSGIKVLERQGCLIEAFRRREVDTICHQANCFQKMGTGIAKDVASNYPQAYFNDKQTSMGDLNKLGTFTKAEADHGGVIYNLYGQYMYGRDSKQTDYHYLKGALRKAVEDALINGYHSIGIPYKIGCVNAGGDWDTVKTFVIEPIAWDFKNTDFTFIIFNKT